MNKYTFAALVLVLAVVAGGVFLASKQNPSVGATPGTDFSQLMNFQANFFNSGRYATTSQGTAITVTNNEFRAWANSSIVDFAPGLVAVGTLTFPASSTVSNLVPRPGDRQTFCIRNATSTAGTSVILAGSTGINLIVASSSATALGSKEIRTGKVGCITLVRQAPTTTTYDIDALLTVYQ